MNNKKINKVKNNRRNKRRFGTTSILPLMRLCKVIQPTSQRVNVVVSTTLSITTFIGAPSVGFDAVADYYNLSSVGSLTDFTDTADSYLFFSLRRVDLEIVRSVDEGTITTNLRGNDVYLGYYPILVGSSVGYNDLARDVNSYRIDPMTFDTQLVRVQIANVRAYNISGGVDYWINPREISPMNLATLMAGELAIATSNTTNNVATVKLFTVKVKFFCTFYHRK